MQTAQYKRMFTCNAWNCYFRLHILYTCMYTHRQFGETVSNKFSDRLAILPARHQATYSPTHAPRKCLYGMQERTTVVHILVQGFMAYSKGACECPIPSSVPKGPNSASGQEQSCDGMCFPTVQITSIN
jgi:hypothetical protein